MPIWRSSGGTKAPPRALKTARSSITISPATGCSSPAMQRSVVVLPQPLGPSKVNSSPFATSKDTPRSARTSPLAPAKTLTRSLTLIIILKSPCPCNALVPPANFSSSCNQDDRRSLLRILRSLRLNSPSATITNHARVLSIRPPEVCDPLPAEQQQRGKRDQHHAQNRGVGGAAVLPHAPDHRRNDHRVGIVEHQRHGQFLHRMHGHPEKHVDHRRRQQRHGHAAQGAQPGRAGH